MKNKNILSLPLVALAFVAAPVCAADGVATQADNQQTPQPEPEQPVASAMEDNEEAYDPDQIVVTADVVRGAVDTEIPPIQELKEADILAYGASSLTDLLAALAPQTGSGRGRGDGQPVILLNGQRISGFRELRDLPPEAVKQVQIFPEEVALKYGYRADQRVINIILKDNFASYIAEAQYGAPQQGGFSHQELESRLTRIGKKTRLNISMEYEAQSRLTEDERDIISTTSGLPRSILGNITGLLPDGTIDPALGTAKQAAIPAGIDNPTLAQFIANANALNDTGIGQYRSLLPKTERYEVNTTWSTSLGTMSSLSLNANYQLDGSSSLLGLAGASFTLPATSPYSPFSQDVTINRYFTQPRALERESETHTANFSATFNSFIGKFRWTVTGDYSHVENETKTNRNVDFAALQAGVANGSINPFASNFGKDLLFLAPDLSNSLTQNINLRSTLSGSLVTLPAGDVQATFTTGFTRQMLDSESWRSGITTATNLNRNQLIGSVNIDVPLSERDGDGLGKIGEVAINGNVGATNVSDFGTLIDYGAGLRWSPAKGLTFQASLIGDQNAPSISQLGSAVLVTPNVAVYDFSTGQSVFANVISGGNPNLLAESRRDIKLSANWSPPKIQALNFQVEYFRNNSRNTTEAFPLLTPEIEAAFPGRVVRDVNGRIISVDQTPVNFARKKSQRIRYGFNFSGGVGPQPEKGPGGPGGPGGGRPGGPGAGGPGGGGPGGGPRAGGGGGPRGPGGPGGGGFGFLGGGQQPPGRWQISLYDTFTFQDDVLIRAGVPVLDLLNGSATSSNGGTPRHQIELSGGVFYKGFGFRLQGNYKTATRVNGSGLPGSSNLRFGDQTTLDAFFFADISSQKSVVKALPFLKGARVTFRIENLLNDAIDVRDQNGLVPLGYQRGYLNPRGRYFEIGLRKAF